MNLEKQYYKEDVLKDGDVYLTTKFYVLQGKTGNLTKLEKAVEFWEGQHNGIKCFKDTDKNELHCLVYDNLKDNCSMIRACTGVKISPKDNK